MLHETSKPHPGLYRRLAVLLLVAFPAGASARAADLSGYDYFTPQVTVFAFDHFSSSYDPAQGHYGVFGGGVEALFPFYASKATVNGAPRLELLGRLEFTPESPDITEFSTHHTFYKASAHVDVDFEAGPRDAFFLSVGPGFAEDDQTISSLSLRYTGILLGSHAFSDSFALDYGGSYSYSFGRGHLLPILGFRWDITDRLLLVAVLPISFRLVYVANAQTTLGLFLGPDGDRVRFANLGEFPRQPAVLELGVTALRVGGEATFQLGSHLSFRVEGGVLVDRGLSFANGSRTFLHRTVSPGGFAQASFIRAF
jgi:hypothetical protein